MTDENFPKDMNAKERKVIHLLQLSSAAAVLDYGVTEYADRLEKHLAEAESMSAYIGSITEL